jgi:hypothetical protein
LVLVIERIGGNPFAGLSPPVFRRLPFRRLAVRAAAT